MLLLCLTITLNKANQISTYYQDQTHAFWGITSRHTVHMRQNFKQLWVLQCKPPFLSVSSISMHQSHANWPTSNCMFRLTVVLTWPCVDDRMMNANYWLILIAYANRHTTRITQNWSKHVCNRRKTAWKVLDNLAFTKWLKKKKKKAHS